MALLFGDQHDLTSTYEHIHIELLYIQDNMLTSPEYNKNVDIINRIFKKLCHNKNECG